MSFSPLFEVADVKHFICLDLDTKEEFLNF